MKQSFYATCKVASSLLLMLAFSLNLSANTTLGVFQVTGGTISTSDATTVCTSDEEADVVNFTVSGAEGPHSLWLVTDADGNILASQGTGSFDFTNAPPGDCNVYHVAFKAFIFPPLSGVNVNSLVGWYALSNGITVTRTHDCSDVDDGGNEEEEMEEEEMEEEEMEEEMEEEEMEEEDTCASVNGGSISGGPFTFCHGDGEEDRILDGQVVLAGNSGNSAWVVTDGSATTILGLPPTPGAVDFDGAGQGLCLLWHISYDGDLGGAVAGGPVAGLTGCFDLSNSIPVYREDCSPPGNDNTAPNTNGDAVGDACGVNSGTIELCAGSGTGTNINICTSDGVDSSFDVCVTGNEGGSFWIIIDADRNLIAQQDQFTFDFEGAPAGLCIICHVSYEGEISGLQPGMPVDDVIGCVDFSNEISVSRFVDDPAYCFGLNNVAQPELSFQTVGNPVNDQLRLQIESEFSGDHRVVIYDIIGRTLFNNTIQVPQGKSTIDIDATDFDPGMHYININNGQTSKMESFIKESN